MLNLWKPWYVYRPRQLLRRATTMFENPAPDYAPLSAAWGITMLASPTEHLGQCLRTTGIYDIGVSEVLFRLIRPGDVFVDAGANLGYMTLLGSVACGPSGHVISFEPNPHLFSLLKQNVESAQRHAGMAPVELREAALGASLSKATLVLPDPAAQNTGLAYIPRHGAGAPGGSAVNVRVEPIDDVIGDRMVGLMKVDVEGYEFPLLQGAERALNERRIRHIVFEDHEGAASQAATLLRGAGYTVFAIGWSVAKLVLAETSGRHVNGGGSSVSAYYEAPSYLATIEPDEALRACSSWGWRALRNQMQSLRRA